MELLTLYNYARGISSHQKEANHTESFGFYITIELSQKLCIGKEEKNSRSSHKTLDRH